MTQGTPWTVSQEDEATAQTVMERSEYRIWPADAKENIAEALAQTRHEAQAELVEALRECADKLDSFIRSEFEGVWAENAIKGHTAKYYALLAKIGAGA